MNLNNISLNFFVRRRIYLTITVLQQCELKWNFRIACIYQINSQQIVNNREKTNWLNNNTSDWKQYELDGILQNPHNYAMWIIFLGIILIRKQIIKSRKIAPSEKNNMIPTIKVFLKKYLDLYVHIYSFGIFRHSSKPSILTANEFCAEKANWLKNISNRCGAEIFRIKENHQLFYRNVCFPSNKLRKNAFKQTIRRASSVKSFTKYAKILQNAFDFRELGHG